MKRIIIALVHLIEKASLKKYSVGAFVAFLVYVLLAHRTQIPEGIFRYDEQLRDPALATPTRMNVATQVSNGSNSAVVTTTPSTPTPLPDESQLSSTDSVSQNDSSQNNEEIAVGGFVDVEVTPTPQTIQIVSPTPTQSQNFSVSLVPPLDSVTPEASGSVNIKVVSTYESGFVDVNVVGELSGLKANTVYKVQLCHDSGCSTNSNPQIKTDSVGLVNFTNLVFSYNEQKYPAAAIKVYEEVDSGPLDTSNSCPAYQVGATPCLSGNLTFN